MTESTHKKTFGGCNFSYLSPAPKEGDPESLNVVIGFEDALKLHLAIGQALAKINSYKRSTVAGRRAGVNICVYRDMGRITVQEGKTRED